MQYFIMILIIIGLVISDIITGLIKAHIQDRPYSKKMRLGGLNKLAEIIIMSTACGFEIGIRKLGEYVQSPELATLAGSLTAGSVFVYISFMEIISILENYAEINPSAKGLIQKFKSKE